MNKLEEIGDLEHAPEEAFPGVVFTRSTNIHVYVDGELVDSRERLAEEPWPVNDIDHDLVLDFVGATYEDQRTWRRQTAIGGAVMATILGACAAGVAALGIEGSQDSDPGLLWAGVGMGAAFAALSGAHIRNEVLGRESREQWRKGVIKVLGSYFSKLVSASETGAEDVARGMSGVDA